MDRNGMFWGQQQGFPAQGFGGAGYQQQLHMQQMYGQSGMMNLDPGARGFTTISPAEFQQACYFMEKMISAEETKRDSSTLLLQNPANAHFLPVLAALQKNFYSQAPDPSLDPTGMDQWAAARGPSMGFEPHLDSSSQDPHSFAQRAKDLW
jgi:hypothetical protein